METSKQIYAYKETKLDLQPATQGSIISIRLPAPGAGPKSPIKRSHGSDAPVAEDENTFRQYNLATAGSIYNRIHHKSPRSFLWRVLEDGRVLSIRAVDVSRQDKVADANLTLRLVFPGIIKPGCIAFSDSRDHDFLSVFVLTEAKYIYTLSLRPDFFRKPSSTEDNIGDWCKSYLSPTLGFKHAHRMVTLEPNQLLLAFYDGALLKLERNSGGDGSAWRETHYNEGGWGHTIRSMIPLASSGAMRHGNQIVELSTATSIASPATILDNVSYLFTVCIDHQLRIWNLMSGKVAYVGDILYQELEANEGRKVIDPSQSQLVKIISSNEESALCATYSPLGAGEFKFWDVRPLGDGSLQVSDAYPHSKLVPQAPTSEIWTLADFALIGDESDGNTMVLWALWKNNMTYRLLSLDFQRSSTVSRTNDTWAGPWKAMATESLHETPFPAMFSGDPSDTTDKWLHYILCPGRFTAATLETAISIFGKKTGGPKYEKRKNLPIPDRLCSTVALMASLDRGSDGGMNYDQFRQTTHEQWSRFCRLLLELDKQRGEALSLEIDSQGDLPWIILADGVAVVRDCSPLERIWHSNEKDDPNTKHVAYPLFAAASFRDSFSDHFQHSCKTMLLEEVFQEPSLTVPARMTAFYNKCDFASQIGNDEFNRLSDDLEGFKGLTTQVYGAMLELMNPSDDFDKRPQSRPLGEFGNKLVARGVQETVELHRNICLDQIVLLVLVEEEVNNAEDGVQFETAAAYDHLITMMKRLELINWLASTQISLPIKTIERANSVTDNNASVLKKPAMETITILEGVLRHLFSLDLRPYENMSSVITEVVIQICAPDSEYEAPTSVIQCFLLKHDRPDLALEFSRFAGSDPFSVYIQGRANLAANDPTTAATLFKKAAFGIAHLDRTKRHRSAGYLDDMERNLLNAGLPEYYSHIVALYDKEKIYSHVIDFARLALQFIKIKPGSGNTHSALRTEMHSRLFNAAIQTSRYELAHSILALFTDSALQHSSLRTLVHKMCEASYASQLIELPFIGLQDHVDEILAQKCQSIVDVNVGVPYHKILYSWRIKHSDFRGATAISLERLQRLQQSGDGDKMLGDDGLETPVTKQYIALINALSCVDPKQAWILSEDLPRKSSGASINGSAKKEPARKVVTLDDVRRSYQAELDRIAAIQNNQFAFVVGDEMDVL